MSANISDVSKLYAQTAAQPGKTAQDRGTGAADGTFSGMLKDTLENAVDAGRESEKISVQALNGEADLQDVVQSVNNAEMALNTVVKIRDKVIESYQRIMKMPI